MFSRFFILLIAVLLSTGCGNRFVGKDGEQPKGLKVKGNMKPYKIDGEWYYPKKRIVGDKIDGIASWYGDDFHGKPTANGETFNMYDLTSAHKTLPMNTMLLVKNIENGKNVVVRVNDRGPFIENRELDLSKKAGKKIGIIKLGTAKVEIIILGYNGMVDETILKQEQKKRFIKQLDDITTDSQDKTSEQPKPITPIFIQNTFQGATIIENPVAISEPILPKPIVENKVKKPDNTNLEQNIVITAKVKNNSPKKIVKDLIPKPLKTVVEIEPEHNSLEIIDSNNPKIIDENNLSIIIQKSDSTEQPDEWVEEITNLVIKPQAKDENIKAEVVYKRNYYIQVGSFKFLDGAERFTELNKNVLPKNLKLVTKEEKKLFRVRVAGFKNVDEAREFNSKKEFFPSSFLVYRDEVVK